MVHDAAALGGAEEHTLGLVRHFVAAGDDVQCWTTLPEYAPLLEQAGASVRMIRGAADFLAPTQFPRFAAGARLRQTRILHDLREIRRRGVEAVYLSGLPEKLLFSGPAAAVGLPVFWVEHAPLTPLLPAWRGLFARWYRREARRPTMVFASSRYTIEALIADGFFSRDRLTLTYTGAELDEPERRAALDRGAGLRGSLGVSGRVIVNISRVVPEKGQSVLVRAMPAVLAEVPDATLLIGGEGPERRDLEALVRRLDVGDRVNVLGYVEDKWALLAAADVFAFPSIWSLEGFGIVSVEAALLEKPVVASDLGPIPEVVEHGRTGLLVRPGDPAAFADALIRILCDGALRVEMGRAGRERASQLFTFAQVADRTRLAMLSRLSGS